MELRVSTTTSRMEALRIPYDSSKPKSARAKLPGRAYGLRRRGRGRATEPQHDPGAGMGGIALDAGFELRGHRGDDALSHAGGARVGLDVEADAVVGDRQQEIVALRNEVDVNRPGAFGVGVFHGVHHE